MQTADTMLPRRGAQAPGNARDITPSPVTESITYAPVDRRAGLSLREFKRDYLHASRPVILTDVLLDWPARLSWTFETFKSRYGKSIIQAYRYQDGDYRGDRVQRIPLAEFIDKLLANDWKTYPYYLRDDFSLLTEHKELWADFAAPKYCFDWFNLLPSFIIRPGPRIFMGPVGAVTNLHQDMWATHFWMAHLTGRKHWILFPPNQAELLYPSAFNKAHQVVHFDVQPDKPDLERYPLFKKATGLDCTVAPGEIIIVPSNWAHWVTSLDPTISLTHNYMGPGNFRPSLAGQLTWYLGARRSAKPPNA
jgi:histone arginine demethylase JMJD6